MPPDRRPTGPPADIFDQNPEGFGDESDDPDMPALVPSPPSPPLLVDRTERRIRWNSMFHPLTTGPEDRAGHLTAVLRAQFQERLRHVVNSRSTLRSDPVATSAANGHDRTVHSFAPTIPVHQHRAILTSAGDDIRIFTDAGFSVNRYVDSGFVISRYIDSVLDGDISSAYMQFEPQPNHDADT